MADGTHHGSLNDTGPALGAALTLGQDLSGDLAALDLGQLMGLDVIIVDPSAGGSSLPGEEDLPTDLMDLDLDQLMGIDVTSDAPLPRSNTDTFSPLPPTTADDDAPNGVSTPPAALSPAPSPIPAAIVGAPGEGTIIEDVIWDAIDPTIYGGTGTDTLRVDSGDADLTTFAGAITGIEVIDLATDAGANTVTLAAQDVLDMSDTDTVTITGDAGDTVEAGTGWTDGGISGGFHTYTQGLATLLVDTDITVNGDITA